MRIPIAGPSITEKEIEYVNLAVRDAWFSNANIFNERFERSFAEYCGRRFAVSLPSCTSGLHLALLSLGVGPGDEVVVPEITWIASSAPISYVGATPIFADVDAASWCLNVESFERQITPRTKAAIVVDLYGAMPDWGALVEVANKKNVALIEDAAEAVGSRWRNRPAGSFGLMSTFSFHGSKTLTTGEGGMLLVDDELLLRRILQLRDHGRIPGDKMFFNEEVGWKYKMSSMQAALGLAQLERVDELIQKKREIFSWYQEELNGWSGGFLNPDVDGLYNSYWMTTFVADATMGVRKETLITRLSDKDIDVRPFFYPLSSIPAYKKTASAIRAAKENKIAYSISPFGINLPSALSLNRGDIRAVCDALRSSLSEL